MKAEPTPTTKPLLRGHFHQAAFFIALGACIMLLGRTHGAWATGAVGVYSLSLTGLFGVSALYHRPQWSPGARMWMRRADHAAIFVLIAGTGTPIFLLALPEDVGRRLFALVWLSAGVGILQSLFWVSAPKWFTAVLCLAVGYIVVPYMPELATALGTTSVALLISGGIIYTAGALVYAFKRPDPLPRVFGYHEIFHLLVVVAAVLHFLVIERLVR